MLTSSRLVRAVADGASACEAGNRRSVSFASVGRYSAVLLSCLAVLSGCGGATQVRTDFGAPHLTQGAEIELYPDDKPSVPDGQLVWNQQNCAQCHGATGAGGSAPIDLSNVDYMRKQKPIDQFMFVAYAQKTDKDGRREKTPNHTPLTGKVSTRQLWNLVFYVRSLGVKPLTDEENADAELVYGPNCMVCHGKKGYGDGPLAHSLEPQPANFQTYRRFYDRSDDVLWDHIANGIKWEGMPNFLGKVDRQNKDKAGKIRTIKFDQEFIWKLVGYIRHFQETTVSTAKAIAQNPTSNNEANQHAGAPEGQDTNHNQGK